MKTRVNLVLHYRNPAFWISIVALLICVVAGVCFLTNPKEEKQDAIFVTCVSYEYSNANMELLLPEGWEYEIEEYSEDAHSFGINFWPEGLTEEKIRLHYWPGNFGVCGTGLTTEERTLENGLPVGIGTYDNSPVWSYLLYGGMPGSYVATNGMSREHWKIYEDPVMNILGNVKLGVGILTEEEAIDIAQEKCTVEYETARGRYDFETGRWKITFSKMYGAGKKQTITVDAEGMVAEVTTQ